MYHTGVAADALCNGNKAEVELTLAGVSCTRSKPVTFRGSAD
jgi:hypothetical protein